MIPMQRKRKVWATRFPYIATDYRKHPSQPAAYREVAREAENWRRGVLQSPVLAVYVDERDGQGWQLYERINLAEWAKAGEV